jgi:transglutaminase-like putative cysteine protease
VTTADDTSSDFSQTVSFVASADESPVRLPWPFLLAAMICFASLYVAGDRFMGIPILGVLLVASAFTQWRLPRGAPWEWTIRAAIFAAILANFRLPDRGDVGSWYVDPTVMKLAGFLLAGELTLRLWQRRKAVRLARDVFFLTACIMATSAVTYVWLPIHVFAPLYAAATIMSMRSLAAMDPSSAARPSRASRWTTLRGTAFVVALGLGAASVFVYERLADQLDNWAMTLLKLTPNEPKTVGFSTANELLASYDPEPSMSRVLLIDGQMSEPHLRVIGFDTYAERRWRPFLHERAFRAFAATAPISSAPQRQVHISMLENTSSLLPLPLSAAAVSCNDPLEVDALASLRDSSRDTPTYDLAVAKSPDLQGPLCAAPNADQRQRLLTIPQEIDPKIVELAKQVAGAGNELSRVIRIEQYLRSHHAYSLSFTPHGEPLSDFILNNRAAHCQYFASALVVMARAIGVPARYVGGFYAHESRGPDQIVVRERDAHAWAECWIDGVGWWTLDATPAAGLPDQMYPNPPAWRRWWERILDFPGMLKQWLANAFEHARLAVVGAAIVVPLIIIVIGAIRRRRPPTTLPYSNPSVHLVELARQFESWLATRGIVCPPNQTWTDCIVELDDRDSPLRFASLYNEARFGGKVQALGDAIDVLNLLESQHGIAPNAQTR